MQKAFSQHIQAVDQRKPSLHLKLAAKWSHLCTFCVLLVWVDFVGLKESRSAVEVWHCERPGEAAGEFQASAIVVETPGLKGT